MRSRWRVTSTAAAVISSLVALTGAAPALAQDKPAKPAAAPAAKQPAKPAVTVGVKVPGVGAVKATAKPLAPVKLTDKQKKDAARKAYKEAETKYKEGAIKEALELYKTADDLLPIPATKYKIASCQDKLGHVVQAAGSYQIFLDSSPDAEKMAEAITDTKARLDLLKKTPGTILITTEPANPPKLAFALDGGPPQPLPTDSVVPPPPPGSPEGSPPAGPPVHVSVVKVVPGHHKLTATAEGFDAATSEFDLTFAETRNVKLALNLTPPPPPPPPPIAVAPPPPPPPPPPPARSNVPAYVTLGLAGAGAVMGTIFGVSALSSKSDFNKAHTTDNADKTDRNALISDMSFAVALTFGVTGAVLLLSDPPAEAKAAANGKLQHTAKVRGFVAPFVGPTGGGAGAFLQF